ncbi:MAG: hypothetical protein LBJ02_04320 [Bifidobacteriaceae bacterium]|nr:hypothetical protein [Bifidobacteriaceae bacterium]
MATLKVDGSSATVLRDLDGELRVMSCNWEIGQGDNTCWSTVSRDMDLFESLKLGEALQFEIAGPGIQTNHLRLPDVRPFVFAANLVQADGAVRRGVPLREWPDQVRQGAVPVLAEGIVWHEEQGVGLPELDGRSVFKVVNNKYLAKNG